MKKYFYIIFLFVFVGLYAQKQSLSDLSTGWLQYNVTLYNQEDEAIGYVLFYNKGYNSDETKINNEYIILDQNLNKVTNGDFDLTNNKDFIYNLYEVKLTQGKLNIIHSITKDRSIEFFGYLNTIIDVKTKEVITKKRFDNEKITEELVGKDLLKNGLVYKLINKQLKLDVIPSNSDAYYITTNYDNCLYYPELDKMEIYNSNNEKIYSIGELKNPNNLEFQFGKIENNRISMYLNHNKFKFGKVTEYLDEGLQVIDGLTGQLIYKVPYNTINDEYAIPKIDQIDNHLVVTGELKKSYDNLRSYVELFDLIGLRRTLVDENGKVTLNKNLYLKEVIKNIDTEKKKYNYIFKEVFNHNDFSFTVVLERSNETWVTYSSLGDFLLLDFDKDGNFIRSVLVEKNLASLGYETSLLFSQHDPISKEILFYFYENEKLKFSKSRTIVFNKYKDGILTQEEKSIKSDGISTKVYPAKYGYVLMIEYDKKGKPLNQRLERTNL